MNRRIFFDASLVGVARVLEGHVEGIVYPGHPEWPYSQDAPDEVWLRYVGERDWCAIFRDRRIRYRRWQRAVLEEYRVRAVVVATTKNLSIEENVALLLQPWDDIEMSLDGPPSYTHLTKAGLKTMLEYDQEGETGGETTEEQSR